MLEPPALPEVQHEEVAPAEDGEEMTTTTPTKKRNKKLALNPHEALTFSDRGIYVDLETGELRCSCNHKGSEKWDAYGCESC